MRSLEWKWLGTKSERTSEWARRQEMNLQAKSEHPIQINLCITIRKRASPFPAGAYCQTSQEGLEQRRPLPQTHPRAEP